MELWQLAIPVTSAADARRVIALLRKLRVPLDPCAGDPRYTTDEAGRRRLLVIVNAPIRERLRDAGVEFEVVRDFVDRADPRTYVSRKNRFAEELARLRASKSKKGR